MKKLSLFMTLMVSLLLPSACSYDDTDVWNAVDDLDQRVTALEEAVNKLTDQTSSLQQMLDNKLFIVSMEETEEGYKLNLMSASGEMSTMHVRHGANGADGANGSDGKDGNEGNAGTAPNPPAIGVTMGEDGTYYWTIDGEILRDDVGNPIPVNGKDGQNGQNGQNGANGADGKDGQDGKTPTFKIENGQWYVSFDNGINWTGPYGQATGVDGDAFFQGVVLLEGGKAVKFTLIDGSTVVVPLYQEFNIAFDVENFLIVSGESADIPFTITGANPNTIVEAFGKNGWVADVIQDNYAAGILRVTAPADKTGTGRIIVLINDGGDKTLMRTLTFVSGSVTVSTSGSDIGQQGGTYTLDVTTNLDFETQVAEDAKSWLSITKTRAYEERTESFEITATANDTPYSRIGIISLVHEGTVIETISVVQAPVTYDRSHLVLIVDPAQVSGGKITLPGLYMASGSPEIVIDWGDGSEKTTSSSDLNSPTHVYTDTSKTYIVEVTGKFKEMQVNADGVTHIVQWGNGPYKTITAKASTLVKVACPEPETKQYVETVSFDGPANGTSKLESIDPDFFKGMVNLTNLNSAFRYCTKLKSLADGMFDDCKKVTNIYQLFDGCTSLEKVPAMPNLGIENTTGRLQVANMFRNCKALKEIPENMFDQSAIKRMYNFQNMFSGCESLQRIPDGFFKGALGDTQYNEASSMANFFYNCYNLEYLNLTEFFNEGPGRLGYSWGSTFYNCSKLQGKIDPYILTVNGTTYEVYPWDQNTYIGSSDPDIYAAAKEAFGTRQNTNTAGCFTGCTSLEQYTTQIPKTWGGLFDPNAATEPPTLTVSGIPMSGMEYYAINFSVSSQRATTIKYILGSLADYEFLLPQYNNDVTRLVDDLGSELTTQAVNTANSSSVSLPFMDADPETTYRLVVEAINDKGMVFKDVTVTTGSVPKGTDAYEAFLGQWRVTSTSSTTEEAGDTGPISFDIMIEPYRTNESYMVSGWGTTIFRDHPQNKMRFLFENGQMNAYAGYAGPKSMWNTIASRYYPYTHETYGYQLCDIGMFAYGQTPDGNFSVLLATPNTPILSSTVQGDIISMKGGQSSELAGYGVSKVYGMDIFINTGGMGWSFTRRPLETVLPEYVTTINGVECGKYALGDYTLTKISGTRAAKKSAPRGLIKLNI
ncbi:MAG: hypothetical protein J1F43_00415 [Muribaculaceae bacterium]|nr:hypothetical protein [Muribaculaceae bacterium]